MKYLAQDRLGRTRGVEMELTHKNRVWVVGRTHPRLTSSVVVTSVHVIHSDTSWPASRLRTNLFVQILANRAQRLFNNHDGESNRTIGLAVSFVVTDRVVESAPSSSLCGARESGCWASILGAGVAPETMEAFNEH